MPEQGQCEGLSPVTLWGTHARAGATLRGCGPRRSPCQSRGARSSGKKPNLSCSLPCQREGEVERNVVKTRGADVRQGGRRVLD